MILKVKCECTRGECTRGGRAKGDRAKDHFFQTQVPKVHPARGPPLAPQVEECFSELSRRRWYLLAQRHDNLKLVFR